MTHIETIFISNFNKHEKSYTFLSYETMVLLRNCQWCISRRFTELLLLLACGVPKLRDGWRSSAWGKELFDLTSNRRSWSELSSSKWRDSNVKEPPSEGKANKLLGLKQEPSLSTSSLLSTLVFVVPLLGLFIAVLVSRDEHVSKLAPKTSNIGFADIQKINWLKLFTLRSIRWRVAK